MGLGKERKSKREKQAIARGRCPAASERRVSRERLEERRRRPGCAEGAEGRTCAGLVLLWLCWCQRGAVRKESWWSRQSVTSGGERWELPRDNEANPGVGAAA